MGGLTTRGLAVCAAIGALAGPLSAATERPPVTFEANRGQADRRFDFVAYGPSARIGLTPTETSFALKDDVAFRVRLLGANIEAPSQPQSPSRAVSHYYIGSDPDRWLRDVPHFARVRYANVYPGVDVVYYDHGDRLEYDFELAPGATAGHIRLAFEGTGPVHLDARGDAVFKVAEAEIKQLRPVAYQETPAGRRAVYARYTRRGAYELGIDLGPRDPAFPVTIDPAVVYSTYLGSVGWDEGNGVAVDAGGNAYVVGLTSPNGNRDASVTKLDPSGQIVYRTVFGGNGQDGATAIALDAAGNVYVCGWTWSWNFPEMNPSQNGFTGGLFHDAFVTKLNASGAIVYSTYLGGMGEDFAQAIGVDAAGNAYVAGRTNSTDFPTVGAAQPANAGGDDVFLTKFSPTGARVYSSYFGGSGNDIAKSLVVVGSSIYITGRTTSTNLPVVGPLQGTYAGGADDAFVARFSTAGGPPQYSTYLGTADHESAQAIAVDATGAMYVTGWRIHPPANVQAWTAKIAASGTSLAYSVEGRGGQAIVLDGAGGSFVTGVTDIAYSHLGANGAPVEDFPGIGGNGIARAPNGDIVVTGHTDSTGLAVVNAVQTTHADQATDNLQYGMLQRYTDAFVLRTTEGTVPPTPPVRPTATPTTPPRGTPTATPTATPTPSAPTSFFSLTPCRIADTRSAAGTYGAPALAAGATRVFPLAGVCGIPPGATAVSINITVTQPTAMGSLTLFPAGAAVPGTSAINYVAGQTRANNAIAGLSDTTGLAVRCNQGSGTTQFILDVNGYFQ
jgi:hypothetical protein